MKFCKDCKWMVLGESKSLKFAQCTNPEVAKYDPVSGELESFCSTARKDFGSATSKCGPLGLLFKPFILELPQ